MSTPTELLCVICSMIQSQALILFCSVLICLVLVKLEFLMAVKKKENERLLLDLSVNRNISLLFPSSIKDTDYQTGQILHPRHNYINRYSGHFSLDCIFFFCLVKLYICVLGDLSGVRRSNSLPQNWKGTL